METLAALLNGREYEDEISITEEREAAASGLVVIFGYSDDNMELRGAIHDEVGCYDGGTIKLHQSGAFVEEDHHDCKCKFCGYEASVKKRATVEALWCKEPDYSWTYETTLPHSTFEIVEDGGKYCRGIVINLADLPKL